MDNKKKTVMAIIIIMFVLSIFNIIATSMNFPSWSVIAASIVGAVAMIVTALILREKK